MLRGWVGTTSDQTYDFFILFTWQFEGWGIKHLVIYVKISIAEQVWLHDGIFKEEISKKYQIISRIIKLLLFQVIKAVSQLPHAARNELGNAFDYKSVCTSQNIKQFNNYMLKTFKYLHAFHCFEVSNILKKNGKLVYKTEAYCKRLYLIYQHFT